MKKTYASALLITMALITSIAVWAGRKQPI
jgi:hypothetical protein